MRNLLAALQFLGLGIFFLTSFSSVSFASSCSNKDIEVDANGLYREGFFHNIVPSPSTYTASNTISFDTSSTFNTCVTITSTKKIQFDDAVATGLSAGPNNQYRLNFKAVCDKPGGGNVVQGNSYTQSLTGGTKTFTCQSDWTFSESLSCNSTHHKNASNTECVRNTQTCSVTNGTGQKTWNGTAYGSCIIQSCNASYKPNNPSNPASCVSVANPPVASNVTIEAIQKDADQSLDKDLEISGKIAKVHNPNSCFDAEISGDDIVISDAADCAVGRNYTFTYTYQSSGGANWVAWCDGNNIVSNDGLWRQYTTNDDTDTNNLYQDLFYMYDLNLIWY
ncbi:MAG: Unknown protein [uncultured Sulfurovum sp.]|uniref:Uncharacterized protein n=1 Tax=uncultured Sulfurovum sp. TaxID=269237 RepID=A0A6S6UL67_9BACT|nr:MAG: Unknown protein [uncultured Sulfurovum sp.]